MSKKMQPTSPNLAPAPKPAKKKSGVLGRIIRRFFLVLFTVIILVVVDLALIMNLMFNGPSTAARDMLTMTLKEPSATKWIPDLFLGKENAEAIVNAGIGSDVVEDVDLNMITINPAAASSAANDEWAAYPDGIMIKDYQGKTFNAHVMLIRDPSRVYLGLSSYDGFAESKPGKRLNEAIQSEGAAAAVNAGAFNDDGTANITVGSVPAGLTIHDGKVVSNVYKGLVPEKGFCGFTKDYKLIVKTTMSESEAMELGIQEGCEFGPVLISNGNPNLDVYNGNSGLNPRTAVGQTADGTVIFVCADGRQAGSMGATYKDMIDILIGYGAVNACNMDGGSSTIMLYRDVNGIYGEPGKVQMINSYSVLQSEPRRMPNYWMVKPMQ